MKIINPLVIQTKCSIEDAILLLDDNHKNFKSEKDYFRYRNCVDKQFKYVQNTFPLLKIYHRKKKPSYIIGYTVKQFDIDYTFLNELDYWSFGICIFGYVAPFDSRKDVAATEIYDLYNFINYKYLHDEKFPICHLDNKNKYPFLHICTNKSKDISIVNFIYTPVSVAHRIYMEYRNVDNGGVFRLECYPHGGEY